MALPRWPKALPYKPRLGDFAREHEPLVERSEADFGSFRQRKKLSIPSQPLTYVLRFTPEENALFDSFVAKDLNDGVARFRMPIWRNDDWIDHEVQIRGGKISERRAGPRWQRGFLLEVIREL